MESPWPEDQIQIIFPSNSISWFCNDSGGEATIIGEQNNVARAFVLQKLPVYSNGRFSRAHCDLGLWVIISVPPWRLLNHFCAAWALWMDSFLHVCLRWQYKGRNTPLAAGQDSQDIWKNSSALCSSQSCPSASLYPLGAGGGFHGVFLPGEVLDDLLLYIGFVYKHINIAAVV